MKMLTPVPRSVSNVEPLIARPMYGVSAATFPVTPGQNLC